MPVIVFRGLEGWCDRLQVLSHCFKYCKKFNTALCVDWDDQVWGGGEFDFNTCFEIVDIKTMTKQQVLRMVQSGRMDIRPKCWTPKKMAQHLHTETYGNDYIGEFMKYDVDVKCPGDVLVTNGRGERTWDVREVVRHLRFKPAVLKGIQERLKDFDPNSVVVHLRGTDRPDSKGNYMEKSIEALKKLPYPIFVITDQRDLWETFHAEMPHAKLVNPASNILRIPPTNDHGTHQMSPADLKKYGITKWDMMLDLMTDWVALVTARMACGREESTYFHMARSINKLTDNMWKEMFGGWMPRSKSLEEYNETLLLSHREQEEVQQSVSVPVSEAQDVC
jgi:hypothetical protein